MQQVKRKRRQPGIDRGGAPTPQGNYSAPALEKAFDVIELLADVPGGATLNEIAMRLGRSIGELFRIVVVMERRGFLQKSPDTDRYTVAYKILDLAYRATPAQHLTRAAAPVMQALASRIAQSCHLVVPSAGHGLVIAREENPGPRGFALRLGASVDLIQSCSGHVLLAFSDEAQRDRLLSQAERRVATRIERKQLDAALSAVRKRGCDRRASPITRGVTDISFPIFGFDGHVVAALTVPFVELIDGSQKVRMAEATDHLAAAARSISLALGYRGDPKRSSA